jgi:hypothetical protein
MASPSRTTWGIHWTFPTSIAVSPGASGSEAATRDLPPGRVYSQASIERRAFACLCTLRHAHATWSSMRRGACPVVSSRSMHAVHQRCLRRCPPGVAPMRISSAHVPKAALAPRAYRHVVQDGEEDESRWMTRSAVHPALTNMTRCFEPCYGPIEVPRDCTCQPTSNRRRRACAG